MFHPQLGVGHVGRQTTYTLFLILAYPIHSGCSFCISLNRVFSGAKLANVSRLFFPVDRKLVLAGTDDLVKWKQYFRCSLAGK